MSVFYTVKDNEIVKKILQTFIHTHKKKLIVYLHKIINHRFAKNYYWELSSKSEILFIFLFPFCL